MLDKAISNTDGHKISGMMRSFRSSWSKAIITLADHEFELRSQGRSHEADQMFDRREALVQIELKVEKAYARYQASQSLRPDIEKLDAAASRAKKLPKELEDLAKALNAAAELINLLSDVVGLLS